MKRKVFIATVGIVALAAGGLYWRGYFQSPTTQEAAGAPGGRSGAGGSGRRNMVVPVLVEAVKTADVPVYLDGVGTVRAYKTVTVQPQVGGRLVSVNFKEGQDVFKGDILARIDPVTYQAAYDQAVAKKAMNEAILENARRDLERYTGLAKSDYASKQQADTQRAAVAQAEAQVRQDQAAVDSAKANLDYTTIIAPIDGRTGIRQVDEGNLVTSSDAAGIVVITQLKPISVLFTLPETKVSDVASAASVRSIPVTASIGSQTLDQGILDVIDNQVDQTTGTVKMKATFENLAGRLWPGQFVNVRLLLKTLANATVVPAAAVQQGSIGSYVYVLQDDSTVKLTKVALTQQDEVQAVIAKGVMPGERVITSGFANLQDRSRVNVSEEKSPQTSEEPTARRPRRASSAEQTRVP
ncbi:efflux RND transporter periplasmic adaptor subunit [Microvirga sp. 2MCAF38]|uniref:efflux RND transporter periplasmic adaptor subunit n=1 Tax=Microvirga sp. 2MCAF38 TaxID=3232989 RepID=UPI003F9A17B8